MLSVARRSRHCHSATVCKAVAGPVTLVLCILLLYRGSSIRRHPLFPGRAPASPPVFDPTFFDRSHVVDPCLTARPMRVNGFDNGALLSLDEYHGTLDDPPRYPAETSALRPIHDLPPLHVFSSSFGPFLFQEASDYVLNLTTASPIHGFDSRTNPQIAERALRALPHDNSTDAAALKLHQVLSVYADVDRARGARFVLVVNSSVGGAFQLDRVVIQRTFDGFCRVGVVPPLVGDAVERPIYIVVPYSGRPKRMAWFLKHFAALRLIARGNITLVVSLYGSGEESFRAEFGLDSSAGDRGIVVAPNAVDEYSAPFSRAVAVRNGAGYVPLNDLMFIADIDILILPSFLTSCRSNAIQNSQVFFPVFYNLFPGERRIRANAGYWRTTSYGMSCMYRSDFDAVSAYSDAESRYAGWGREDLDLMVQFLRRPWRYSVFRAVEPSLRHRWHVKQCWRDSANYADCMQVAYAALGSPGRLGSLLGESGTDLQSHYARFDEDQSSGV
jgi:Chondroitin N-acetylgalactosaminyltransferase